MRLGGRLAGAIEILTDIEERRRPVADALKDWGLSHRFAGSGDRAAIGNIVYDALRMKLSHAWLLDDDSPAALGYAVMFRQWGLSPDALAGEVEGDKFAPQPLAAASLAAFAERDIADAPAYIQGDLPEWLVPSFERNFGAQWVVEAKGLTLRPSLDLRANTLKADQAKVLKALERSHAEAAILAKNGIRIPPGERGARLPNVTAELSFQKGWFEVQDEGSQVVAEMVAAQEGEQVLDYCAGGGGKTLALSASMNNKGQVHAYDADRRRLAPIIERLKRAGTRNVQVHDNENEMAGLLGRCDRVLVDAPCTGTGTWRRRPDTKWRLSTKNVEERLAQQAEVLAAASEYVRPGGKLIYVTCSLLPEENQEQVQRFLEANGSYKLGPTLDAYREATNHASTSPHSPDGLTVTLSPAATNTDGFFIAVLDRVA